MNAVTVRDYMTQKVVSLDLDMEIASATQFLIAHDISGAPVLDHEGRLVGILTERDCMKVALRAGYDEVPSGRVRDFMTPDPEPVSSQQTILAVAEKFVNGRYRRYPVVDDGRLVGIISRRDIMKALGRQQKA